MTRIRTTKSSLVIISLLFAASAAQAQLGSTVANWTAPSSNSGSSSRGIRALADVTNPLPFIGVTPCRIVDTRGPAGTFGGPSLPASTPRNFPLPTGPCAGIPASVSAYSLNITVTNTLGPGFISIYPQGGAAPLVSTLNYLAGQTLANAAIVPAGTSGGVTVVAGVSGTDLIIDINGYYAAAAGNQGNTFTVVNSGGTTVPAILGQTNSTNLNATAVKGLANAATGVTNGVWGDSVSTSDGTAGVFGFAEGTSGVTTGVWGRTVSSSNGARAVLGEALATTGQVYGVYGYETSSGPDSTGIKGVDYSGSPGSFNFSPAGVRGESSSGSGFGVLGISRGQGVAGFLLNSSGGIVASGFLGSALGIAGDNALPPWGVFSSGNLGASGAKHFVEPHPTDASKVIVYSSIEGRTVDTYFRGTARIANHEAVIQVPEDFRIVTDESGLTVQLTPIGDLATVAVLSQDLNKIVVRSSKDVAFHYLVQGVRRAFKDFQPVQTRYEFMPDSPDARMPQYLTEEAKHRLIANGTYNADGSVNMDTAERLGWTKMWAEREAGARAAAQEAQKAGRAIRE
jgi:hypothetical protein